MSERQAPADILAGAKTISVARIQRDVEYMASDALGGRDTFSPGLDSAAQYITRRLQRAGLRPLGDRGTYFQHYTVTDVTADTAGTYLIANGRQFTFGDIVIRGCERAISAKAPVVYVGHGFRVPSLNIDAYRDVDVRGKFVLVSYRLPEGTSPDALPPDAEVPGIAAQNLGALAVLILSPSPEVLRDYRTNGAWRTRDVEFTPPSRDRVGATRLFLAPPVVQSIFGDDSLRANEILAGKLPPSFELASKGTLNIPATIQRRDRYNIVASIPGSSSSLRDEYVTLGAHLDGVTGPALRGDSIYNAADDNASGSAAILAITEGLMHAPRETLDRISLVDWSRDRTLGNTILCVAQHCACQSYYDAF